MNQLKDIQIKTFTNNSKYFKFVNRPDIEVLNVTYTPKRSIRVRFRKKPIKKQGGKN